jgi:hypothetical protein
MPLMPELAVACREWQGKGAHYNVHQARRCKVHILMCTAGKSRAHYNGTTGAAPSRAVKEAGTKRKRAEQGEGDDDGPVGKCRWTEEGSDVQGDCPRPKPLYCTGTTATASSSNNHAPAPNASPHANQSSLSPAASTDAPSTTSKCHL